MTRKPVSVGGVLLAGADTAAVDALQPASEVLASFGILAETRIIPPGETEFGLTVGLSAVIAASSDARLPAALAARTALPVLRVPTATGGRHGLALLDDGEGNLPAGPADGGFATMAIGEAGARNAALFVVAMLAGGDDRLRVEWTAFRARQTETVLHHPPLIVED